MNFVTKLHETPQIDIARVKKALADKNYRVIIEMKKRYPESGYWKKILCELNSFEKDELINIIYL